MQSEVFEVRRVPLKGKPDFTTFSDYRLQQYIDLTQSLLFSYLSNKEDKAIHAALENAYKALSDEQTDRLTEREYKKVHPTNLWSDPEVKTPPKKEDRPVPVVSMKRKLMKKGLF